METIQPLQPFFRGYSLRCHVVSIILIYLSSLPVTCLLAQGKELDTGELTRVEELSESLANALLKLSVSVRQRDFEGIRKFFQREPRMTPWPNSLPPSSNSLKWISMSSFEFSDESLEVMPREQLHTNWREFLELFSYVEDARFKVKGANFTVAEKDLLGRGDLKFFLIGRDREENRFWVKGTGQLEARKSGPDEWRISLLRLAQIKIMTAFDDLFSEVCVPAGVSAVLPPYGSPGNDDFIYHGAAAGDIDRDGFQDLVVTGTKQNNLYLNQGGTFQDVAFQAGIAVTPSGTSPLLTDYDNDGDLDLFLASVGEQMLFQNQLEPSGKLTFLDVSQEARVAVFAVGFGTTAGDVNGDGLTDIYVSSYNHYGRVMPNSWNRASNGTPNLLFVNQGDGTFRESGIQWGVADRRWSYAAQFADVTGDGRLDLYVANDFGENSFYVNLGDRFQDKAAAFGVLDPGNGMGVSFGDFNNDGHLDLYVTNMSSMAGNRILDRLFPKDGEKIGLKKLAGGNTLFKGLSQGGFRDVSYQLGPFGKGWAWGGLFVDFDNDGWADLYSPNGFISGKSMKDT